MVFCALHEVWNEMTWNLLLTYWIVRYLWSNILQEKKLYKYWFLYFKHTFLIILLFMSLMAAILYNLFIYYFIVIIYRSFK